MGRVAMANRFVHEALALQDAEAVLLVDGGESQLAKFHIFFDERMSADD